MPFAALLSSTHRILLVTFRPDKMGWVVDALQTDFLRIFIHSGNLDTLQVVPDLILFDVHTASSEEANVWHQLKTYPLTSPVPIIFLCANPDVVNQWPGCWDGDHYIVEPQSAQELRAWVQEERVFFGLSVDEQDASDASDGAVVTWEGAALVEAAKRYLSRHYALLGVVDDVVKVLQTDVHQLTAAFHNSLGITVAEYLIQERMRHAQRLLLQSSADIADIAQAVGYGSAARFTTEFRMYAGVTPSAYRRNPPLDNLTIQGAVRWTSL